MTRNKVEWWECYSTCCDIFCYLLQYTRMENTHVLWTFSPAYSPQQFPPYLKLLCILLPRSTLSSPPDSMLSSAFLSLSHPPPHTTYMYFFIRSPSSFCNTWPSHLNWFCLTTPGMYHCTWKNVIYLFQALPSEKCACAIDRAGNVRCVRNIEIWLIK